MLGKMPSTQKWNATIYTKIIYIVAFYLFFVENKHIYRQIETNKWVELQLFILYWNTYSYYIEIIKKKHIHMKHTHTKHSHETT
jgi:hypothetical protein